MPTLRRLLAFSVLAAAARGALVVAQASVLADVLARGFLRHAGANSLAGSLVLLVALVGIRAGLGWLHDAVAQRTAATVKQQLRHDLLDHSQRLGPGWLSGQRSGELTTVTGTGLDALDDYVTGYLPQLVIATVVPVAVIARLAIADWPSAVVIVVTLPLIPIFGALVGWHTRTRTARQWGLLTRLGGHFLDAVRGLPTLRAFGRAETQVEVIRRMAEAHRRATMRTLRVAFL
ncbi:MAG: ABC transporter transmembrane domain-containing protein, partial [Nocardioidaceae bacterium]